MRDYVYYLHTNGELISKRALDGIEADFRESDFVRHFWFLDTKDRESAWGMLVEALALGAKKERVMELAEKWGCNDIDADTYAERVGCVLELDGNAWHAHGKAFINPMESCEGFGDTKLEAMADLCRELGFKASKMWGGSFKGLVGVA